MLNLKKEANQIEVGELKITTCPICSKYVSHLYFMQDADSKRQSKWYSCSCGIIFQDKLPTGIYDKKYWGKFDQFEKKLKVSYEYPVRIYSPIIEELLYGRRVLILGRTTNHQEQAFAERGWIPLTIDKNTAFPSSESLIVDDFESHEFDPAHKFNMIWIYATLECFKNPIASLIKCHELLTEDGILFIASPDTDSVNTRGSSGFIHWKPEHNHIMWNKRSITHHLETLGFNIILCRSNYEHRFPVWDDFHLIAQRRFF